VIVALAVAGVLGGTILGALAAVEVDDGEDERPSERACERGDPSLPIDESDVDDSTGRALRG
jgi:hypothetical protein